MYLTQIMQDDLINDPMFIERHFQMGRNSMFLNGNVNIKVLICSKLILKNPIKI